jgi:predicted nucleic acid-binding protein
MGARVFIDTGAFLARVGSGDQHHGLASKGWDRIQGGGVELFSSEPVLVESANFLARAQGCRFSAEWLRRHRASKEIRWLQPGAEDFDEAAIDLEKFSDQRISFTDALSFALMRCYDIRHVFGFDRHFLLAGFGFWQD